MRDRDIGGLKVSLDQEEQSKTLGGHHGASEQEQSLGPFSSFAYH